MSLRNSLRPARKKKLESLYSLLSSNAELLSKLTPLCEGGNEKDTSSFLKGLKLNNDFDAFTPEKYDRLSYDFKETETVTGAVAAASYGIKKNVKLQFIPFGNNERVLKALALIINTALDEDDFITVEKTSSLPAIGLIRNEETALTDRSNVFETAAELSETLSFENGTSSLSRKTVVTETELKDFLIFLLTDKGGRYLSEKETEKVLENGKDKVGLSAPELLKRAGLAVTGKETFLITEKEFPSLPLPLIRVMTEDGKVLKKEMTKRASVRRKQAELFEFGIIHK